MTHSVDEFDAVRTVVDTLKQFDSSQQAMILRWACDKLQIATLPGSSAGPAVANTGGQSQATGTTKDIKTFIANKQPRGENQLATSIAYFFQFEAPEGQRKNEIGKDDITDGARQAEVNRPKNPAQVLVNAFHQGYLDKGSAKGLYRVNSVGENLVAMVLPNKNAKSNNEPRKSSKTKKKMGKQK